MVTVGEQGALIGVGDLKWVVTRRCAYHRAASSREHRFISEITTTAIIITALFSSTRLPYEPFPLSSDRSETPLDTLPAS